MKSPRFLSLAPASNYPNFQADSIYTFNRILGRELARSFAYDIRFAVPPAAPREVAAVYLPVEFGKNQYEVRFGFDWQRMSQLVAEAQPEICFVNMPEHAAAMAILLKEVHRSTAKLVTYVHYLPAWVEEGDPPRVCYEQIINRNGLGAVCLLRLLEGVLASDLVFICSHFAKQLLIRLATLMLGKDLPLPPIEVLAPPVDFAEIPDLTSMRRRPTPFFVYNHRLYDHYGTPKMFALWRKARGGDARDFRIVVTNPLAGRAVERARINNCSDKNLREVENLDFAEVRHFPCRAEYYQMLAQSSGGFAPVKPQALWSMSVMDLLACGRPVLSFKVGAFPEMLPPFLLVENEEEFVERLRKGMLATTPAGCEEELRGYAACYSAENMAREFDRLVRRP